MAAGLTTSRILATFTANYANANTVGNPQDSPTISQTNTFAVGASANQANHLSYGNPPGALTITNNTTSTIDLSALVDPFGTTFSLVSIGVKGIIIQNTTLTAGAWLLVAPSGTNPWNVATSGTTYGPFTASTRGFIIGAGSVLVLESPVDSFNVPDSSHCRIDLTANPTTTVVINYAIWG